MAVEHPPLGQALGAGGQHVLLVDLVEKGILGQHRQRRETADHQRRDRQRDMPEIIEDALGQDSDTQLSLIRPRNGKIDQ